MSKLLFMNVPGVGHVNPTLPVVTELVKHGHEVIYYNTPDFQADIERTGAQFKPYPAPNISPKRLSDLADNLVNITLLLFEESYRLLPFVLAEIEQEQPDALLFDSICLWGQQGAILTDTPHMASITTLVFEGVEGLLGWRDYLFAVRQAIPRLPKLIKFRRQLLNRYGKQIFPNKDVFPLIGDANLLYTSRLFQPKTIFVDDSFHLVGPSFNIASRNAAPDFPFDALTRSPVIYISLGTVNHRNRHFYQTCFEAFGNFSGQFVLSVGKQMDIKQLGEIPDNFIVRQHVPQLELLPKVDLFITHGGINSVQEALYFGVPLIVVPQQMEQLLNGRYVASCNAGILIGNRPKSTISANMLQSAVTEVMVNDFYKAGAQKVGDSFKRAGGFQQAVKHIETFIQK